MQMAAGLQPHFDQENYVNDLGEEEEEQRRELIMACVSGVIAGVFAAFTQGQVVVSNSGEGGGKGVGRPFLSLDTYEVEYLSRSSVYWRSHDCWQFTLEAHSSYTFKA
uniref:Uncharacterized protein n=1 Tax=Amphimedon queenslandica TaxID=400682 RepID=A0A1X7SZM5_AMPQE